MRPVETWLAHLDDAGYTDGPVLMSNDGSGR